MGAWSLPKQASELSLEPGSAAIDTLRSQRAKVGVVVEAVLGSPNTVEYDHMSGSDVP